MFRQDVLSEHDDSPKTSAGQRRAAAGGGVRGAAASAGRRQEAAFVGRRRRRRGGSGRVRERVVVRAPGRQRGSVVRGSERVQLVEFLTSLEIPSYDLTSG